ncbi:MAG: hypothetical protein N2Z60_05560, partial [Elusimicrobiales bacterium]|nr:hypothetical protein [Elusimicrobiales bacterium]
MKTKLKYFIIHLFIVMAVIITTYPLLRIFSVSIRPGDRIISTDLALIPDGATFISYIKLFKETFFIKWIFNSLLITFATSFIGVTLASTAAYAFSRYNFTGKKWG